MVIYFAYNGVLTTAAKGWVAMMAEGVPIQHACCCFVKVKRDSELDV
jgi:hypothetical protein